MVIRAILGPARLTAVLILGSAAGCHHSTYPNPFAQPAYGTPWATPGSTGVPATTTFPPPPGQVAPAPTVPGLPPPQGIPVPSPPPAAPTPAVQFPDWNNPGSMSQQQQRANVFDPFANNEVGPEVVGGRPRDFQKPITEATRAKPYRESPPGF